MTVSGDDWGFAVWAHNAGYPTKGDELVAMSKPSQKKDLLALPTWTDNGSKHMRAMGQTDADAKALSTIGRQPAAQYGPTINVQALETEALNNGFSYRRPQNHRVTEYYYRANNDVGYDGGVSTEWVFVEWTRGTGSNKGTYHGRPMIPANMPAPVRKALGA